MAPGIAIAFACVILYGAWLTDRAVFTHEGIDPYERTEQLVVELRAGNLPPQVLPDARLGSGSAFARFYPPISHGTAALLTALSGGDNVRGVNLAFFAAALASGLSMAWAVRQLGGSRPLATGAALVYLAVPYHLFDVHVRGALGEAFSFVWFPLIMIGTWGIVRQSRFSALLVVATTGLLLTHVISALLTVVGVIAILSTAAFARRWRAIALTIGTFAVGTLLAAWFLVPQQRELRDVWAGDPGHMRAEDVDVESHALEPGALIGTWENGFRGYDHAPTAAAFAGPCPLYYCGSSNFVVGPVALALPLIAIGLWLRTGRIGAEPALLAALSVSIVAWIAFIVRPPLTYLPAAFGYVQFPWRALAPMAAATTLLWVLLLRDRDHGGVAMLAIGAAAVVLVPATQRQPTERPDITERCFTRADVRSPADPVAPGCFFDRLSRAYSPPANDDPTSRHRRSAVGFTSENDYLPVDADELDPSLGTVDAPTLAGPGRVVGWARTREGVSVVVDATRPTRLTLPVTAYRFTRVTTDRGALPRVDQAGVVVVEVPAGRTALTVGRGRTRAELLGWFLSAWTAAALALRYRRHRRTPDAVAAPSVAA